ncbi:MAG: FtsX-like permease family protein [Weeksellaceae bacterium]
MKNVSFYIAKRYNSYTLLISIVLITSGALLIGTMIYIGNASLKIFRELLYGKEMISNAQNILIYTISIAYFCIQTLVIYYILNRLLKTLKNKRKIGLALLISLISLLLAGLMRFLNIHDAAVIHLFFLLFISVALLSLLIGLLSFLLSNRKITGVNIITSIAVFAITIATTALFIILSVFSGLEKMNIELFSSVNPDLKILPTKGKLINNIQEVTAILDKSPDVASYSKVIEEKVSIEFEDKQDIAYIKGVEENYKEIIRIDTTVVYGSFIDFDMPNEILVSDGVARRIQMYIDHQHIAKLRMPKPGKGLIRSEEDAFNTETASPVGVFVISGQYDKYVFAPIELTRNLLELPGESAYSIEIELHPGIVAKNAKAKIQTELGNDLIVQTRQDMDATFLKVMNMENFVIYMIFTLVIIIASFNLAGAIIIIIIEKTKQIKTMQSFGMSKSQIKTIFFQTGMLITIFSVAFGLFQGSIIGWLQNHYHLIMANAFVPFPFEFTTANYLIVILTVVFIGGFVSWAVSRKLPE